MKTSLTLCAAAALLVLTARPALADDDYHGGARWDHGQTHYRGGDHGGHGYRDHGGYRPRVEHHYYHRYHERYPVHYYRPSHHYYDSGHHHHHDNRDLLAIIGGAILVTEIIRD
ncbi:MAG: hypothetical protein WBN86_11045 [Porticoccaceae bacterium]